MRNEYRIGLIGLVAGILYSILLWYLFTRTVNEDPYMFLVIPFWPFALLLENLLGKATWFVVPPAVLGFLGMYFGYRMDLRKKRPSPDG